MYVFRKMTCGVILSNLDFCVSLPENAHLLSAGAHHIFGIWGPLFKNSGACSNLTLPINVGAHSLLSSVKLRKIEGFQLCGDNKNQSN